MSAADGLRKGLGQTERPFALPIEQFIAAKTEAPPPLIGTADDCILSAYGLLLYVAKGGKGKTTSTLDAILHLASGVPWLNFEVPRPLRVLFIENEGPREPFRRKLERRLAHWPHPLPEGAIHVYSEDWGQAGLDDAGFIDRLNRYVADHGIDLVVGDPLDTLGMEGVGSPKDTREMVARLQEAGLFTRTAWWILHHARKGKAEDAIDEASGSWGGKPDALLGLERLPDGRARLAFHKLRWGRSDLHRRTGRMEEPRICESRLR
ncbi:MAG: AAA family ATPase [Thermoleophilia bacterium]|nr:AAA family ATPase [Thermoleophilia bacterium]